MAFRNETMATLGVSEASPFRAPVDIFVPPNGNDDQWNISPSFRPPRKARSLDRYFHFIYLRDNIARVLVSSSILCKHRSSRFTGTARIRKNRELTGKFFKFHATLVFIIIRSTWHDEKFDTVVFCERQSLLIFTVWHYRAHTPRIESKYLLVDFFFI